MTSATTESQGCGDETCLCGSNAAGDEFVARDVSRRTGAVGKSVARELPPPIADTMSECISNEAGDGVASVNGVPLHEPGDVPPLGELHERAYAELLRQEAVRQGRLPALAVDLAPEADEAMRMTIEDMLDEVVTTPPLSDEACKRHYAANQQHFKVGQASLVRHILFAVMPGVDVQALARRAEVALLELGRTGVATTRFAELARELSNCPSGAAGGDLGWLGPADCAPELAKALFLEAGVGMAIGLHPRLVHTRHGFHIIEVLDRREGQLPEFEAVRERIAMQLGLHSRATALRQYMLVLAGQADLRGLDLERADTPLVQ